jgi:peptidoglycan/xylan/chitin deacetylase (PgdA/CDA1 family)
MKKSALFFLAAGAAAVVAFAFLLQYQSSSTALTSRSEIVVTNFQQDHGFVRQSSSGTQGDDTETFALGVQSLKLTTDGDGSALFTRKALAPAMNLTDRTMKVWIRADSFDNIDELRVSASGDDFRTWTDYWIFGAGADARHLQDDEWNLVTIAGAHARQTGDPDMSRIDAIQVRVADRGTALPATVWINSIALTPKNDRAIITFAFDGGYESDYLVARPVLDKYHFSATAYVVGSLVGSSGRLSVEQLRDLQDLNGWDIASHSFTHSNLTQRARPEVENDLALSKQFLERNGLYRGADHFAYPQGEFDSDDLRSLVPKYFSTARIAEGGFETLPPPDPYHLRTVMIGTTTTPAQVSQQVQDAIAGGDWLILVFHRIVESTADQRIEYPRSNFEQIVDDVASRGVDVLTVSEVHDGNFR